MLPGIVLETRDYRGRDYADFHARRDSSSGPGWYIFGRAAESHYSGNLVMLCARPDRKARRFKNWNGRVRAGWRTKAEADRVALALRLL